MRIRAAQLCALACIAAPLAGAAPQVQLRGVAEPVAATVRSIGTEGVILADAASTSLGQGTIISWDVVRTVDDPPAPADPALAELAANVWRARARVERGDWAGAEPLLESLAHVYRNARGPSAAVVHEGLLRCRLRRGAQGAAVWAWLDWTAALRTSNPPPEQWIGGRTSLPPVRDAVTDLVPGLPPIWVGGAAMAAVAASDEWLRFARGDGGDAVTDLAALYRHAAAFEAQVAAGSPSPAPIPAVAHNHAGVRLVAEIVSARTGDQTARAEARVLLLRRITGGGPNTTPPAPWVEAWCRAGIGRSLVLEQDPALRRKGVRELLHIPARFGEEHSYLAGVCLAEAAVTMAELGEPDAARILVAELRRRHPAHPALAWERLGVIADAGRARGLARSHQ